MAKKDMHNQFIFDKGNIVLATRFEIITLGLGKGCDITDLAILKPWIPFYEVFNHTSDGDIIVTSVLHPEGKVYDKNREIVVRIINGQVLFDGLYDLDSPHPKQIERLFFSKPSSMILTTGQYRALAPVLAVASDVIKVNYKPAQSGMKVIEITSDMLNSGTSIKCHCPWNPADYLTEVRVGDYFIVKKEATFQGYPVKRDTFNRTYMLE